MDQRRFAPGFRLSMLDVVILIVGAIASAIVFSIDPWIGSAIAFVVLHFFLFCNILRMSRPLELMWAGIFAALSIIASLGLMSWWLVFGFSLTLTIALAFITLRQSSYHGIAWQRFNPDLQKWWEERHQS